jgi:DNA-binding response OmpR family regulator
LSLINTALPLAGAELRPGAIGALAELLREPQTRVTTAADALLALAGAADVAFAADVRRIREAAERLESVLRPGGLTGETDAHAATETATVAAVGAADTDREAAPPQRILVVDDLADNRELLDRRLRRQGYLVDTAENGRVALEMISTGDFDLILLDIMMPEVDGYEVLRRVKANPATRDIPVVMISAVEEIQSVVRCIEGGADDYLPKPFDPVLLRARVGACLEKKRLRDKEVEYLRQVAHVTDAASAVDSGSYASGMLATVAVRPDELGRLARVFDKMATEVRAREERLRGQLLHLTSEIEEARKARRKAVSADRVSLP